MPGSATTQRLQRDIIGVVASIPAGRIATHGSIARHLGITPGQVVSLLAALDPTARAEIPWWRVVADGGAIGRHVSRDEQMQKLRGEGIPVAPAGIAGELAARRFEAFGTGGGVRMATPDAAEAAPAPRRSLSRGMKSHPEKY